MSSQFMACHPPPLPSRYTFWTHGSGFATDEAQSAKLERHADHVVAWFEYIGPHGDEEGE